MLAQSEQVRCSQPGSSANCVSRTDSRHIVQLALALEVPVLSVSSFSKFSSTKNTFAHGASDSSSASERLRFSEGTADTSSRACVIVEDEVATEGGVVEGFVAWFGVISGDIPP